MSDSLERKQATNPNSSGWISSGASHRTEKAFPPTGLGKTLVSGPDARRRDEDPKSARRAEWFPSTRTLNYGTPQ